MRLTRKQQRAVDCMFAAPRAKKAKRKPARKSSGWNWIAANSYSGIDFCRTRN